jgi:hypothetical protein
VRQPTLENGRDLGVSSGDRIADDDAIHVGRDLLRIESQANRDAELLEERAHGGVELCVHAFDVMTRFVQQPGKRRHRGAADRQEVQAFTAVV